MELEYKKIQEAGNRDAVFMTNGSIRIVIDANKGMIPEFSAKIANGWINAHWQPWFRANSGEPWDEKRHSSFWKVPLLYDIAGNFPCVPNFGPEHRFEDYNLPPHGYTSLEKWNQETLNTDKNSIALISTLAEGEHPFRYKKTDLIIAGQNILYTRLDIKNTGSSKEPYNCGWHNTVGSPFLESGCFIDNNANKFSTSKKGTDFDDTGRLAFDTISENLEYVPLREGGTINLREVNGVTGYSDFITGAVPKDCTLGWCSIVNPRLNLVYLSFFTGPSAIEKDDIALYFYDLWMNYGGRSFTPWAALDGMTDQTFCLGAENITGFYSDGLKQSIKNPQLLGNPTYLTLDSDVEKSLYYGTLFQLYPSDILDRGIKSVTAEGDELVLTGYSNESFRIKCDYKFRNLKGK